MSTTRARIGVVAGALAAGFCIVVLHLWYVMVHQHEAWAQRSRENRWAFRSVPSQRGMLLDRHGRVLAHDEPAMQLSVYYLRFRLRHPVGAAVHGATRWAALQPDRGSARYGYADGALGPMAAAEHLLAMPARVLKRGVVEKEVAADLAFEVTTVLSACSGLTRRRVYSALREAASAPGLVACGDVLPMPRDELLAAFAATLASLRRFDAELVALQRERLATRALPTAEVEGLMARLDDLRRRSLAGQRVTWTEDVTDANGATTTVERTGSLVEEVTRVLDDHVPFEFAARLRVGAARHPGLEVHPSIRRVVVPPFGSALAVLLGSVREIDRARPNDEWFHRYVERELPADWVAELPAGAGSDVEADAGVLQQQVVERYVDAVRQWERRGTAGLEWTFDDTLMGRLGMRLVERDASRREQALWTHLGVEAGDDVRVTVDADLQAIAERRVAAVQQQIAASHVAEADRGHVQAALAVIDAGTGDVLAYAGAPVDSSAPRNLPGVWWKGNGSLGSVVKPLVLVEQLRREALAVEHRPIATFDPCAGKYVFGHQSLGCLHAHGDQGRDPVDAIAVSCNSFFFQCAEGFGAEGVAQALRRFGLCRPAGDADPFAACWQPSVAGVPIATPRLSTAQAVPMRAVGYGVEASPLSVARAYAALATGSLPTLGLRADARRPVVALGDVHAELEVVRAGLRACVDTGTARDVTLLRHFGVFGKTGTAEVGRDEQNNAWFAGYLPGPGGDGVQLCFCAVVYWVPHGVHGDEAAGRLVADWLAEVEAEPTLAARYLAAGVGR
ncbi:MAG: hypothetical protein JNL08_03465 [Planctomycetes bacterium]|nr:hypothetical protein [Planctomycetota bacterium]